MKRAHGFSLVELMLALALGVIVTAGIVQLFVGNNQTYALLNGQSRLQESARFSVDFIARSARAAGYLGCDPEPTKIYKTLNGTWAQLFEFNITQTIQAYTGTTSGNGLNDWVPSLATLPLALQFLAGMVVTVPAAWLTFSFSDEAMAESPMTIFLY